MKFTYEMNEQERREYVEKKGKQRAYNKMSDKLKYIMKEKMGYES